MKELLIEARNILESACVSTVLVWPRQELCVRINEAIESGDFENIDRLKMIEVAAKKILRVHGNGQPKQLDDAVLMLKALMTANLNSTTPPVA